MTTERGISPQPLTVSDCASIPGACAVRSNRPLASRHCWTPAEKLLGGGESKLPLAEDLLFLDGLEAFGLGDRRDIYRASYASYTNNKTLKRDRRPDKEDGQVNAVLERQKLVWNC